MSFTVIIHKQLTFVIFDSPSDRNAQLYIDELKKHKVKHILRVCESTYDITPFTQNGIEVITTPFKDGDVPPHNVIINFLELVNNNKIIGVHCVAGLGRAPVLVAIALIESGMDSLDAIAFIRNKRSGSINTKQLKFLEEYKKQNKKCSIM